MKKKMNIIFSMVIIALIILSTIILNVSFKNNIKEVILEVEYNKVGGKDNYEKINKIQKKQIKQYLNQQLGNNDNIKLNNKDKNKKNNNIKLNGEDGTKIDKSKLKKVKQGTYILGNPNAEITWIEYSDLECPFCKRLHNAGTIDEIIKEYDGKVNFIFKSFPLSFHKNAGKEAEAILCAGDLGGSDMYYSYIKKIFDRTTSNGIGFPLNELVPLAVELGIDDSDFQECLDSGRYSDKVKQEMKEGASLFKVTGTPGNVIINNESGKWTLLPGAYPFSAFKQKIDFLLKNK